MDPVVGRGKYTYKVNEDWAKPPANIEIRACAVSVDSHDRVYCFNRNPEHAVVVFDHDGNFLSSWGAGLFKFPHAIRIDENDFVWLCDEHPATPVDPHTMREVELPGRIARLTPGEEMLAVG